MGELLWWWAFAVLAALVVFLLAAAFVRTDTGDEGRGVAGFVADVRAGLRTMVGRGPRDEAAEEDALDEAPQVRAPARHQDTDLDAFLAATQSDAPAYVDPGQITETLVNARDRAARTLHVHRGDRPWTVVTVPAASLPPVETPTAAGLAARSARIAPIQAGAPSSEGAATDAAQREHEPAPDAAATELVLDRTAEPPWFSSEPRESPSIRAVFPPVHPRDETAERARDDVA